MSATLSLVAFLKASGVPVDETGLKVHLACWNGSEDPIDSFYAGKFKEYQEHQTRRNFECAQVIGLIDVGNSDWLFAGVYQVLGSALPHPHNPEHFLYRTKLLPGQDHLIGRIKVRHERSRASYVWHKGDVTLPIIEILRERHVMSDFPGFNRVRLAHRELKAIMVQAIPSWKAALCSVSGIYLITDTSSGEHYVGKASGEQGIWGRWAAYADNGHGGNVELKALLRSKGATHMAHFQYSVLEIADTHASDNDILARESHWMKVLGSRAHGLNG